MVACGKTSMLRAAAVERISEQMAGMEPAGAAFGAGARALAFLCNQRTSVLVKQEAYEHRDTLQLGGAGPDRHPADSAAAFRREKTAGARPRHGSGGEGVQQSEG